MANLDRDYYLDEQGLQTLINELETNLVALEYSSSATYAVGDYCVHDNKMYRCTTAISTAEAWNSAHWSLVIIGDELKTKKSGTVTSVTIKGTSPIVSSSSSAITTSGTRTISHADSGVTAGDYTKVTVNATGHVTAGSNPTTLSGYGITDAKIESGTITLGSDTITPLTSHQTVTDGNPTLDWNTQSTVATIGGTDIHVTMPSNPNTDESVKQKLISTNYNRPLLMSTAQTSSTTSEPVGLTYRNNSIYANPSTGTITATKFVGALDGNATSATNATTVNNHTVNSDVPADAIFTDTTYSAGTGLSLSETTFSVKTGYTTSGNNRKVQADPSGNLYVVQTDNNTTYSLTQDSSDGHKITLTPSSGTAQTVTIPDNNTTYTFAGGTNKFTVTPSGGTAQDVTITPSISDNITGSGTRTSGYIAKFSGTNTITNGPKIGTSTTTYLNEAGSWATPLDTKNTAGSTNTTSKIYLVGTLDQTTGTNSARTYSDVNVYATNGTLTSAKTDTKAIIARTGTGTAGSTSETTPKYTPTKWTFNSGITVANGEVYFIKIPVAGGTYGVWCSLNNGTNYYPVAISSGKGRFTTHYAANTVIAITYESAGVCTCYPLAGGDATSDVTGIFRVLNDYDANTTYSAMSSSELTTGTVTTSRVVRSDYLKAGINSLIDTKINALDVTTSGAGVSKTLTALSETDGKISATFDNISITKLQVSDFAHSHGNITNAGVLSSDITIANGDQLVVTDKDSSTAYQIARSPIKFDASTTTKALTPKGTWETFLQSHQSVADNNPTLAWSTKSKVATIGSTDIHVTMPDNPNTDTKVSQGRTNSTQYRKILLSKQADDAYDATTTSNTDVVYGADAFSYKANGGILRVPNIITSGYISAAPPADNEHFPAGGYIVQDVRNVTGIPATLGVTFIMNNWVSAHGWSSGLHVKSSGSDTTYSVWELMGYAGNGDGRTQPLYVRGSNKMTAWGDWRKIYDSSNPPTASEVSALPISGGTMTGVLKAYASQYTDDGTTCAIDMQNSNIVGLNSIYTADSSSNAAEGIHFYRDATHVDTLWMNAGDLLFVPNREIGVATTKANSQKVGRFTANPTSGQVVVTDGTTGGMKTTGYTIKTSVPENAEFTDTTYTGTSPISINSSTHVVSLSTVPIANGGTNGTTKLEATDSLSVLYGLAGGTLLVADQDCDSLTVGKTYYSSGSTLSDDLVNPPTTASGFKIYTLGTYSSNYPSQIAIGPSGNVWLRGKYKDGSNYPWTDWRTLYHTGNLISQPAASGGTTNSLVTTGEKYTWNSKQNALTRPVTGAAVWSVADRIVVTNANSGNVIKQSAYTIATSVPQNAKFTDTWRPLSVVSGSAQAISDTADVVFVAGANMAIAASGTGSVDVTFSATDTKNTAGTTNSTKKLYLVGAETQDTNPQTYSNVNCYTSGGKLYSNGYETYTSNNLTSKTAASGGTAVSLVTTGEKYTWNNIANGFFGTCSTGASTVAKTVTVSGSTAFALAEGVTIRVRFTSSNTASTPTLNVNSTGAKNIVLFGSTSAVSNATASWYANSVVTLTYAVISDVGYWVMNNSSTYITQTNTTGDANYQLLFTYSSGTGTSTWYNSARKSAKLYFNPTSGLLHINRFDFGNTRAINASYTLTPSSPPFWTAGTIWAAQDGSLVQIELQFLGTDTNVAAGVDGYTGTLSGGPLPARDMTLIGYTGSTILMGWLTSSGSITIRANQATKIPLNSGIYLTGTFLAG